MQYYHNKKKLNRKYVIIIIFIIIIIIINIMLNLFDNKVFPYVLENCKIKTKSKTAQIVDETSLDLFKEKFKYNDVIIIEKDEQNNITMIKTNTLLLNNFTTEFVEICNEKLYDMGNIGINVPLGWASENSVLYELGPEINIKLEPVGNLSVEYGSTFESAGINQTRHKIFLKVEARVKINVPMNTEEILVKCEIPITETIIVGKIPDTALDFQGIR